MSIENAQVNRAFVKPKREGKARGGRPKGSLKLSKNTRERFLMFLRGGAYIETACALAGISKQTFYDAVKTAARARERCDKDDTLKLTNEERRLIGFLDAVAKAQAESEMRDLATITEAALRGVWQAAAWRLERKFPEKYGRREGASAESEGHRVGFAYVEVYAEPPVSELSDGNSSKLAREESPIPVQNERLLLSASSLRETLLLSASSESARNDASKH